jgi:hypothetical protein
LEIVRGQVEKVKPKGGRCDQWEEEGIWKKEGSHGRNFENMRGRIDK